MTETRYDLQFKETYPSIFEKLAYFAPAFGGTIEAINGIENNEDMFKIKTKVDSVVINDKYDTDANKGMGTGTANSSRFGAIHENKWINKSVKYTGSYSWNEGIDLFTVNNDPARAVADVTGDISELLTDKMSLAQGKLLADSTLKTITKANSTADDIIATFDEVKTYFVNNRIKRQLSRRAYVKDDVENILVNAALTTTAKGSTASVENGHLVAFKGFIIEVVPADFFPTDVDIIFAVDNVAHAFLGINTARTLTEVEGFDGTLYQGAVRYGEFIPEENKKGIAVAKLTGVPAV